MDRYLEENEEVGLESRRMKTPSTRKSSICYGVSLGLLSLVSSKDILIPNPCVAINVYTRTMY